MNCQIIQNNSLLKEVQRSMEVQSQLDEIMKMHEQSKFSKKLIPSTDNRNHTKILELKNMITQWKNSMDIFKSRLNHKEKRISDPEERALQIIQTEEQKLKKKNEENIQELWDTIKEMLCMQWEFQKREKKGEMYIQ